MLVLAFAKCPWAERPIFWASVSSFVQEGEGHLPHGFPMHKFTLHIVDIWGSVVNVRVHL